jgi:hypothetical protein
MSLMLMRCCAALSGISEALINIGRTGVSYRPLTHDLMDVSRTTPDLMHKVIPLRKT